MITAIQTITQEDIASIREFSYTSHQATLLDIAFDRLSGRISHEKYHAALESAELAFNDSNLFLKYADSIKESVSFLIDPSETLYGDDRLSFETKEVSDNKMIASLTYESPEGEVYSTEAVAYRLSGDAYAIFSRHEYGAIVFRRVVPGNILEEELQRYTSYLFDRLVSEEESISHLVDDFSFHPSFLPF